MTFGEFLSEVMVTFIESVQIILRSPAEWIIFWLLLMYLGYKWKQRKVKRNE